MKCGTKLVSRMRSQSQVVVTAHGSSAFNLFYDTDTTSDDNNNMHVKFSSSYTFIVLLRILILSISINKPFLEVIP